MFFFVHITVKGKERRLDVQTLQRVYELFELFKDCNPRLQMWGDETVPSLIELKRYVSE